jgi:thiamine monophosphate kinase
MRNFTCPPVQKGSTQRIPEVTLAEAAGDRAGRGNQAIADASDGLDQEAQQLVLAQGSRIDRPYR